MLDAEDYLLAARVPDGFQTGQFGDWRLDKFDAKHSIKNAGFDDFYCLRRRITPEKLDYSNIHKVDDNGDMWDVVMEDSTSELEKHLPIWMNAKGHVLKTGLGLGCVVRGLLINPLVTRITIVEIDQKIIDLVGPQFGDNPKVEIHLGDAMEFDYASLGKIDYAWHDIWTPENKGLQLKHAMLVKLLGREVIQGAWAMPRFLKRVFRKRLEFIG